jgi:D-alanyl-D-alanine carboxypeptidase/D-alanyl-D-alanine-endopeptidase (penicillin-binding protein 4)
VNPIAILIVCSLLPAMLFAGVWRWADARRVLIPPDPPVATPVLPTALATPVLSLRRAPQALANSTSRAMLAAAMAPVAKLAGDASCLTVAVDGRTIYDFGATTEVTPASNLKLLVASVALEVLGPDYTFTTQLRGIVDAGVVVGDLYFVGGGDPLLSTQNYPATQKYPTTNPTPVQDLVTQLTAAGITSIQGNVVGDDSRYDTERFSPAWGTAISGVEAGPLGALMVNDATRILSANSTARFADPAVGAATNLVTLLQTAGIVVGGSATSGSAAANAPVMASVKSAPLSAVLAEMLTNSDNNTAELLLKELSVHAGTGGTRQAGIDVVTATLAARGMDMTPLVMHDGSGLDSANQITCDMLVQVLEHESLTNPIGLGLPIAGRTGTLADEFLGTTMVSRMHAKTGSLRNAKALSGYVTSPLGEIEFSLVLSFPNAKDPTKFRPIWSALSDAFNSYPAGPDVRLLQPL